MAIQQYSGTMTIVHRAGKKHLNADALSRCPMPNNELNPARVDEAEDIEVLGLHILDVHSEFLQVLKDHYEKDQNLTSLMQILLNPSTNTKELISSLEKAYQEMLNQNQIFCDGGILYLNDTGNARMIIPKDIRIEFLELFHDDFLSIHTGIKSTIERINKTAWWPTCNKM